MRTGEGASRTNGLVGGCNSMIARPRFEIRLVVGYALHCIAQFLSSDPENVFFEISVEKSCL